MDIRAFEIPDIKLIVPKRFTDSRGYFFEAWRDNLFRQEIAGVTFVQENQSMSAKRGTVRGLHFQKPPAAQGNWCASFAALSSMWPSTSGGVLLPTAGMWLLLSMLRTERNCGCHRVFFMGFALWKITRR
jgi:hypothetical protein